MKRPTVGGKARTGIFKIFHDIHTPSTGTRFNILLKMKNFAHRENAYNK